MYVKDWEDGPQNEIPRSEWQFAKEQNGAVVPDPEHVYMKSGFHPGKIYSVVYEALNPVVAGSTLMSVRDIGSWIKYGGVDTPIKNPPTHAYAYGISQTGRLLRHYLYAGMNLDENERQVYDGLIPHVAGGRRGDSITDSPNHPNSLPLGSVTFTRFLITLLLTHMVGK